MICYSWGPRGRSCCHPTPPQTQLPQQTLQSRAVHAIIVQQHRQGQKMQSSIIIRAPGCCVAGPSDPPRRHCCPPARQCLVQLSSSRAYSQRRGDLGHELNHDGPVLRLVGLVEALIKGGEGGGASAEGATRVHQMGYRVSLGFHRERAS